MITFQDNTVGQNPDQDLQINSKKHSFAEVVNMR